MKISSAVYSRCFPEPNDGFGDSFPQVVFIGRSNVGKSSVINSLVNNQKLARSSSTPGITQVINLYLINDNLYFVDLPGYGFAKGSKSARDRLKMLIDWYLFESNYKQKKVVLIIDAFVGMTKSDLEMFSDLSIHGKNIVIVANKVDKIKKSEYKAQLQRIRDAASNCKVIEYSSFEKKGVEELTKEVLN